MRIPIAHDRNPLVTRLTTLLLLGALAACAADPPAAFERENLQQMTARIDALQQETRRISLRAEDGSSAEVVAGPEVRNFDQMRVGDRVVVSYYQALAAEVKKEDEVVRGIDATVVDARANQGERPYAGIGAAVRSTVVIDSIDKKAHTVTFWAPDGRARTLAVQTDDGRKFIEKLRKGDEVEVLYTEAIAVEVMPAS